jgi:hypothetical protein
LIERQDELVAYMEGVSLIREVERRAPDKHEDESM